MDPSHVFIHLAHIRSKMFACIKVCHMLTPDTTIPQTMILDTTAETPGRRLSSPERRQRAADSRRRYRERNRKKVRDTNTAYKKCPEVIARLRQRYHAKRQELAAQGLLVLRGVGRPRKQDYGRTVLPHPCVQIPSDPSTFFLP